MNPGDNKTLVLPARLVADTLSSAEKGLRDCVLQAVDAIVLLADGAADRPQCTDAPFPNSTWLICPDEGMLQRSPHQQWAPLTEFLRNGPPAREAAASLSWWLRFSGRTAANVIVFVHDDLQWLAGDWSIVLASDAPEALRQQAQQHVENPSQRIFCATARGWQGWKRGAEWFGLSPRQDDATQVLGATPVAIDRTFFRVWAPRRKHVDVVADDQSDGPQRFRLKRDSAGYHTGFAPIGVGQEYRYALDTHLLRPDPASHFQPRTVHEHSQVTSTHTFPWTDGDWSGVRKQDLIIYETHIGAFSSSGDYRGALKRIPYLRQLGVTAIELLPLAQTPGRWNWGYDGVAMFAPNNNYGRPDELKALVDACHQAGIAVILDVVYNHLGPEGNYLNDFGPYFSQKRHTPWGGAFNFDGWLSEHVRRLIVENAVYWLDEFHLDGLRLDAVHFMFDENHPPILSEIRAATAEYAAQSHREIHLIAEANMFDEALLAPAPSAQAYDAIWCDCLMHSVYSVGVPDLNLTYREFRGAQDIAEALRYGYLYEMPVEREGGAAPEAARTCVEHRESRYPDRSYLQSLVVALQTHDSVGNHPHGKRLHQLTSLDFQRAAAVLTLLYPSIPMIFMGEESSAESPFPFFADFGDAGLRDTVDRGRAREYPQHQWDGALAPSDPQAFWQAKCNEESAGHPLTFAWYQQLLRLRKQGIAEGWLGPNRLHVECDVQRGVFLMRYSKNDTNHVWVACRLSAPSADDDSPWQFPGAGHVLLDSRQINGVNRTSLALQPNHALVIQSEEAMVRSPSW